MASANLKLLLNEYSKKRDLAISTARMKKDKIYSQNPKLQEIELALSKCSIAIAKEKLSSNNSQSVLSLQRELAQLQNEKAAILKSLGLTADSFKPSFSCKLCNDTGYISLNDTSSEMCKCLKQQLFDIEYNKYNVYNMQNNTFEKFDLAKYSDKIDKQKYGSNISPRSNMEQVLKICQNFIKNFDDENEKNLLFTGTSGLGKTFLSNCIANELLQRGKTVLYQTSPVMLDTIIDYRLR